MRTAHHPFSYLLFYKLFSQIPYGLLSKLSLVSIIFAAGVLLGFLKLCKISHRFPLPYASASKFSHGKFGVGPCEANPIGDPGK